MLQQVRGALELRQPRVHVQPLLVGALEFLCHQLHTVVQPTVWFVGIE